MESQEEQKMSKNALKKKMKLENWEKNKAKIKEELRERDRLKKEEKRKARGNCIEEKQKEETQVENDLKLKEEIVEIPDSDDLKKEGKPKKEKLGVFIKQSKEGIPIVIDCDFESLMTDKEIASLAKQILFIYSRHRKCEVPFHLIIQNVGIKTLQAIQKHGSDLWKAIDIIPKVENSNDSWADLKKNYEPRELVYLTGDSENEITELEENKCYIIGGIVDRNRYKNLTLDIAIKNGISHARLPIGDYLHLRTSQILATNHIFDIICNYKDSSCWSKAFGDIIPKRKVEN